VQQKSTYDETAAKAAAKAGALFKAIGELPPTQAPLVYAQPQAERERIMALDGAAREAAIAELAKPKAETNAPAPAQKGSK
jgi:hypothetical protein